MRGALELSSSIDSATSKTSVDEPLRPSFSIESCFSTSGSFFGAGLDPEFGGVWEAVVISAVDVAEVAIWTPSDEDFWQGRNFDLRNSYRQVEDKN